jgi:hypothetical protein
MRKVYELIKTYEGMPSYVYSGMLVIQNEIEGETDHESYIPLDESITNFDHIPTADVEQSDNWVFKREDTAFYNGMTGIDNYIFSEPTEEQGKN